MNAFVHIILKVTDFANILLCSYTFGKKYAIIYIQEILFPSL